MFSLCIATIDRFDNYLSSFLPKYLAMDLIDEIIITDENGRDVEKIRAAFPNHPKLHLYVNENRLGPLLNKLRACSFAKNEWIALIDSDNFADFDYFEIAKNYIHSKIGDQKNIILAPWKSRPRFDFSYLSGLVYKRGEFSKNRAIEQQHPGLAAQSPVITLMNTGNYILNSFLIKKLDLTRESYIEWSSCCDVIYLNTLFFEQLDLKLHVVPNMEYDHALHDGSIYLQTYQQPQYKFFADETHRRYFRLLES
jgi:Glycosyl transferase family 2